MQLLLRLFWIMLINNKEAVQDFSSAVNLTAIIVNCKHVTSVTQKHGTESNGIQNYERL
jgi:hypothetical protein